jgi:radical SAM superfamily enzyme YgiQ (UPF0313 family)
MKSVLFIQLPPPRFSFCEGPANIPLAAGFMACALKAGGFHDASVEILGADVSDVYADAGLAAHIARRAPSVLAMSLYMWNSRRSLFLGSAVKRRLPETRILIGGPEVSLDNRWVLNHPAVDAAVFGEGESRIRSVLENLIASTEVWDTPGTLYKTKKGELRNSESAPPWDLRAAPYPYLDGAVRPSADGTIFLETVRGCPFRCNYCWYHKAFPAIRRHPHESISAVLDYCYDPASPVREIYLMDPTFNARPGFRDVLRELSIRGKAKAVRCHAELRADLLRRDDGALLKDAGVCTAEVGLQTTNRRALELAGRPGDPERTVRGIRLLMSHGLDVTVGIILGLPGDTRKGVTDTIRKLKNEGAYSVVHPFVLSVLPGSDFRERAQELGLKYDPQPPYYVRSTAGFSEADISEALLECEDELGIEIDHIPPPKLTDRGPACVKRLDAAEYVSKWILSEKGRRSAEAIVDTVAQKAADPFILWFRNVWGRSWIPALLERFVRSNPHVILSIVFEGPRPRSPSFLSDVLTASADPSAYINRYYGPLYGEDAVVNPDVSVIEPDPGSRSARIEIMGEMDFAPRVIWERRVPPPPDGAEPPSPILLSITSEELGGRAETFLDDLERCFHDCPDACLFRDPALHERWRRRFTGVLPRETFAESILIT